MKKIGLARVLCSNRRVIILDCPFLGLPQATAEILDQILRERQENGALVIIAERYLKFMRSDDKIVTV